VIYEVVINYGSRHINLLIVTSSETSILLLVLPLI